MTNLTYFKALIIGREKLRSVGVYHFFYCITPWNQVPPGIFETCKFFVDYKIMKNKFSRKIKEKKELLLYIHGIVHSFNVKNVWHVNKNFACTWGVVVTNLYVPQVRKVVRQDNLSPLSFWRVRYFSKRGGVQLCTYFSFAIWCSSSILLLDHFLA